MKIIYKRSLTFIGFLIAICGFIGIAYLFYDKVINSGTEVVVVDDLSINYIDSNTISHDGTYTFSVTNSGSKDIYYEITYDELKRFNHDIIYEITSKEADIKITNTNIDENNNILADNILIKAGVTHNYTFKITNINNTAFKLKINKVNELEEYFASTIINDNEIKEKPSTKVGTNIATTNEGLIEDIDDYGLTYYFRGNVPNNYVEFAGTSWRIVRINGNGTVKLILNKLSNELTNYNSTFKDLENYEKLTINESLNSFYESTLTNYDNYILTSKFCVENAGSGSNINKTYNANSRLVSNKIPTFNCLGESYSSKIGLITADEVVYAGANFEDDNTSYYLYNKDINNVWWTSNLSKTKDGNYYPFAVNSSGKIIDSTSGNLYRGLRPVINIIKKVTVTGDGTIDNPYKINEK